MAVAITGIGIISALGAGVSENLEALKKERSGIAYAENVDFRKGRYLGQVAKSNAELTSDLGVSGSISRTALLGMWAAKEAWGDSQSTQQLRSGFISGTTVGGMDQTEKVCRNFVKEGAWNDLDLLWQHDNGFSTDAIANYLSINDFRTTLSTACSSAANAILLGARLIQQGKLDRVLVGGTDALTYFTINGFDSLMIFDKEFCKPFDKNRSGLNLGEGAAYLLLESEESLKLTSHKPLAFFCGGCNASDAYHQTASSPDGFGATMAMRGALDDAGISVQAVDYINAHGTGTNNNDLSESTAIINVFEKEVPDFSSTKSYTGHTLAAAGGIEAVFSVLSLKHGLKFSNLNYATPIEETGLVPVTQLLSNDINYVLSNSFGFGGNNTTLIFSKA